MTSLWKKFGASSLALVAVGTCAIPLGAQTTTTATCPTGAGSVNAFSIESVLTLSNVLSTLTPNAPGNILAAITSGAQEIRDRMIYNPGQSTITTTIFTVAPGAPNPTPLSIDVTQQTLVTAVLNIDRIYTSTTPRPSVMFVGTIGVGSGVFGNFAGAPGAISIGYTTDTPAKINNVVELIAGEVISFSGTGVGALPGNAGITFPAAPVTPPATAGTPTIVVNPVPVTGQSLQVFFNPYHVDASQSTDPNKLPLTYLWSSDKPVNFQPSNTDPAPNIEFDSGAGDYTITLTVKNSAGGTATTKFVLTYIGKG